LHFAPKLQLHNLRVRLDALLPNEIVNDAVAENERKRDQKPGTDIEHPSRPKGALDEDEAGNSDDDETAFCR
jgi:hypothetical protein